MPPTSFSADRRFTSTRSISPMNIAIYCTAKGLFDHLVGDREYPWRHLNAERLRHLKVDDDLEFGRVRSGFS